MRRESSKGPKGDLVSKSTADNSIEPTHALVGRALKRYRQAVGRQRDLAQQANVSYNTYRRWEYGHSLLALSELLKLKEYGLQCAREFPEESGRRQAIGDRYAALERSWQAAAKLTDARREDFDFDDLVICYKDRLIRDLSGFGWGANLSLRDDPELEDKGGVWSPNAIRVTVEPDFFHLPASYNQAYTDYFKENFYKRGFDRDGTKFMVLIDPFTTTDTAPPSLRLRPCKFSQIHYYRDRVLPDYSERERLIRNFVVDKRECTFPHALCLHAVVLTTDEKIVIGLRSADVGYEGGRWSLSAEEQLKEDDFKVPLAKRSGVVSRSW